MNSFDSLLLKNKKVLFVAPAFFGYEMTIKSKMEAMGASVDFFDERCFTASYKKALLKVMPGIFKTSSSKYYRRILLQNKQNQYDYVLFVKGQLISKQVLSEYRRQFPKALFVLYLWDSVENIIGVVDKLGLFDRVLTFDSNDVKKYPGILFRPLFFADEFNAGHHTTESPLYEYDISFVGTIHSDRFKILTSIKKYCSEKGLRFYAYGYLQSKAIYYFYKAIKSEFRKANMEEFQFEKMEAKNIRKIIDKSSIVLDIEHPHQTGLTMRTIEMIGMNKKLITTNTQIKLYDFYDGQNICVIDRDKAITIPESFVSSSYRYLPEGIYEKYSLKRWISDVLGYSEYEK